MPFAGTYTWLHIEKNQVRKLVKTQLMEGLDDSQLVRLAFTPIESSRSLKWHHDKEFEFNGQLYDIVRHEKSPTQHIYWCFPDHKETSIEKQLTQLLNNKLQHNQQHQQQREHTITFYKNLFFKSDNINLLVQSINLEESFILTTKATINWQLKPPTPPPQFWS